MYDRENSLFAGASAYDLSRHVQTQAMDQLKTLSENALLSTTTDDLVSTLLTKHTLHFPELREGDTWLDEKEVTREVPRRGFDMFEGMDGGARQVTFHQVTFHLPFDGEGNLFKFSPSRRSIPGPEAVVEHQELVITIGTGGKAPGQVRQEFDAIVRSIKEHLTTLRADLGNVTSQIEQPARTYIEQRKAQVLGSKNLVAALGFPMRRRADAPTTYRAPEVRRKLTPVRPQTVAPFKPEPTLDEAEYQHILNVMDNMTKVMERSPHAFQKMGEEDIRQQFLVQLNGQYEGQATGETFNFGGKTDILIRSEGRNIFIAECKFWQGEKGFLETIDQLLSYLSWRDSKTAIIVFNKNKNLSGVLSTIMGAVEKHPHKKRGPVDQGETRFRYVMGSPNDHNREISMTVMVYDIPTAS